MNPAQEKGFAVNVWNIINRAMNFLHAFFRTISNAPTTAASPASFDHKENNEHQKSINVMKKIFNRNFLIKFILMFIISFNIGEKAIRAEFIENIEDLIKRAKKFVVLVHTGDSLGTGMMISYKGYSIAVTNEHIVRKSTECFIGFLGVTDELTFVKGEVVTMDQLNDIALIIPKNDPTKTDLFIKKVIPDWKERNVNIDKLIYRIGEDDKINDDHTSIHIKVKTFAQTEDGFASKDEIMPGKFVYFIGFPLGLGISPMDPLVRSGIISSKVNNSGVFLLDAMINHGNSGSPVFILNSISNGYSLDFAGIVNSYKSDFTEYESKGINPPELIRLPHNSGLANVISIQKIMGIIQESIK